MMPESAVEEVVIVEEPAAKLGLPNRMRRPGLAIGLTLGSLALSLTAATIVRRAFGPMRRARRGRRGALVVFQPQVSVFAPTVALPFSAITGVRTPPQANGQRRRFSRVADGKRTVRPAWPWRGGTARARQR